MMLLLVIYLIIKTFRRRHDSLKLHTYHYLLWLGLVQVILVSAILYGDTFYNVPELLDFIIVLAYFFGLCLCTYGWFMYSEITIDSPLVRSRRFNLLLIAPLAIYFLLCISSWWTHLLMYIDEEGKYQRGSWAFLQFLIPSIYALILTCRALSRWKKVGKFDAYQRGVLFFPMSHLVAIVLQILYGGDYIVIATITSLAVAYIELYSVEEFELDVAIQQAAAQQREKHILEALNTDLLTKLSNRRALYREVGYILEQKRQCVYLVLNMHNFKRINLLYGQKKGDELLVTISGMLCEAFPDQRVCRLSGDVFGILYFPKDLGLPEMSSVAHTLFSALHKIKVEGLEKERFNFSVGAVLINPGSFSTPDEVFAEGEIAHKMARDHTGNFIWLEQGSIPDVEGCFIELSEDRILYNAQNNRLFAIQNEQDWFNYLRDGAVLKEEMFRRNVSNIDDIMAYFKNTDLPDFEYDHLFKLVTTYAVYIDPFMFEMLVCDILIPHYEAQELTDRVRSYLGHLYLLMADSLVSVIRMGDQSQLKNIWKYLKKARYLTQDFPHDSIRFEPYFFALCEIVGHYESLQGELCTMKYLDEAYEELRELLTGEDPFVILDQGVYEYFAELVENARLFPVFRACYLLDRGPSLTEAEKAEFQQRLQYIREHQKDGVYDLATDHPDHKTFVAFLQSLLFTDLTTCQRVDRMMAAIRKIRIAFLDDASDSNIVAITYLFLGITTGLNRCAKSAEEKRRLGIESIECLIDILRNRQSCATDNDVLLLNRELMRAMFRTAILPSALKYHYIKQTTSVTMLDTYCHSRAVSSYAKLILTDIIDHQPELLVGPDRPYESIDEVRVNRQNLLNFMDCACMLHDIGKANIIPITSNAYRRLTDREFGFIRLHPVLGMDYLKEDKTFEAFTPFVLEHHRWYNGAAGYPKVEAGQTPSKLKVLVDLLSICDSLEAATSRIGRNYRSAKNFLQILDEFIADAGTRYSADIVGFILSNRPTFLALRQRVDKNWQKEYLAIFQEVISHPDNGCSPVNDENIPGFCTDCK